MSSEYDRNALTIIGLKSDSPLADPIVRMIDTIKITDKFYDNDIGFRIIPFNPVISLFDKVQQEKTFKTDVVKLLNEKKVGQAIVAKWFNRQPDGTFNTSVLKERGIYNSDDSDLSIFTASKRGESAMWISKTSTDSKAEIGIFDATTFPLVPVKSMVMPVQSTQSNPGQPLAPKVQKSQNELIHDMVKSSMRNVMNQLTFQVSEFKVKAQIYKTNPIAVKIEKKEGLGFDQRYFVFENRMTRNGQEYSSRRGVIKSMSVVDNRTVTSGETQPSYFYQVAGWKIDNLGMFVEQRNDVGLNLFLGYQQNAMSGIDGRVEFYIGRAFYSSNTNKIAKGITSFTLYVEGGYNNNEFKSLDRLPNKVENVDLP